jgi:hypothetical protein
MLTALVVLTSAALVGYAFRAALAAERGRGAVVAAASVVLTEVRALALVTEHRVRDLRDELGDRSITGDLASGAAFRVREVAERGAVALLDSHQTH